jgi:hypothetical protein
MGRKPGRNTPASSEDLIKREKPDILEIKGKKAGKNTSVDEPRLKEKTTRAR